MPTPKRQKALRLTLGGAPDTWHTVVGLPGHYHPSIPAPVGGPGETPVDVAEQVATDPGCPVELVDITAEQAAQARDELAALRVGAVRAVREAIRNGDGETPNVKSEQAAVSGQED